MGGWEVPGNALRVLRNANQRKEMARESGMQSLPPNRHGRHDVANQSCSAEAARAAQESYARQRRAMVVMHSDAEKFK